MRHVIVALIAIPAAMASLGAFAAAAAESCMIGDAALCLAHQDCHWDGEKRGCDAGPRPCPSTRVLRMKDEAICDRTTRLAATGPPRRRNASSRRTSRAPR